MGSTTAFGEIRGEKLEVLLDGERLKLFDWDKDRWRGRHARSRVPGQGRPAHGGVTFLATHYAPVNDLNKHFLRSTIETGGLPGFTFFPHVGKCGSTARTMPQAASDTPSRQQDLRLPSGRPRRRDRLRARRSSRRSPAARSAGR